MKENWVYRRGDIYLANLGVPIGSKQGGVRPVVVLQNDVGNFYSPTITVAPLTTKIQKKRSQPTHYFLRKAKGLARSSMVLAEQLDTCDKTCVIRYLGKVSKGQMRGIDEAVKVQLGYYIPEQAEKRRQGKCRKEVNLMVDKLIKRKEAAEMLGISLDTLDHARMEGLITYVQYVENGCVYFTEVGLQEYIARSTHRARPKDNNPTFRKKRTARSEIRHR